MHAFAEIFGSRIVCPRSDSRSLDGLGWTGIGLASPDERVALLQQNERDARTIVDNQAIPVNLRFDAERAILDQWLNNPDLVTTVGQAAELDQRIDAYLRKNPAEPRVRSLQLARAGLLLRVDKQKGIGLLETLSRDEDSKLASAAKAKLADIELIGKPLDLKFTSTQGNAVNLQNDFHGKVVLIDFWASWCPDCIRELPSVQKIYAKYKDKGFAILGISLDKDENALANFVARKLIPWPQFFDGKGWDNEISTRFGISSIPAMWLIDQDGRVVTTDFLISELDGKVADLLSRSNAISQR
jgi:thiol-disulfide isomerase/thioredoxin